MEVKTAFDELMSKLDTAKRTINEPEDMLVETSKTDRQIETGKGTEYLRTVGQ